MHVNSSNFGTFVLICLKTYFKHFYKTNLEANEFEIVILNILNFSLKFKKKWYEFWK